MSRLPLSIVIPTSKGEFPELLLESIKEQSLDSNLYEVLVVFNKKEPTNNAPILPFALNVLFSSPCGVNRARNLGIVKSIGDHLLFLDDDCKLTNPKHLERLLQLFKDHPSQMSLGGPYSLPLTASKLDRAYFTVSQSWIQAQRLTDTQSLALLGGNAGYKKEAFNENIQFPDHIQYGGSETPLNSQIKDKYGPHLWCQDLAVEHNSQLNLFIFLKKAFLQGRGAGYAAQYLQQQNSSFDILDHTPEAQDLQYYIYSYDLLFFIGYQSSVKPWPLIPLVVAWNYFPPKGFYKSLFVMPNGIDHLPWHQKINLWTISFTKKWLWLFLKIVGRR